MEPECEAAHEHVIVIIDHGTRSTKFGLSTDPTPHKIRSVVGYPVSNAPAPGPVQVKDFYVGDEAISITSSIPLTLKYPYHNGRIQDFEVMGKIWTHIFEVLGVDPKNATLWLTQSHFGHSDGTKQMVNEAFQRLDIHRLIVCNETALPVYQTEKNTGLVIDSGEESTYLAAVYQGHALQSLVCQSSLAGAKVSDHLVSLLTNQNIVLPKEVLYKTKEKHSNVLSTAQEAESNTVAVYDLDTCFQNGVFTTAPEVLFDPSLHGEKSSGLHEMAFELIQQCPEDIRKDLYGNIVLSGGNTLLEGFPERLEKEIKNLYHHQVGGNMDDVIVVTPSEREFGAWKGAVEVTKMKNFVQQCISEYEYNLEGEVVGLYKYDFGTSEAQGTSSAS